MGYRRISGSAKRSGASGGRLTAVVVAAGLLLGLSGPSAAGADSGVVAAVAGARAWSGSLTIDLDVNWDHTYARVERKDDSEYLNIAPVGDTGTDGQGAYRADLNEMKWSELIYSVCPGASARTRTAQSEFGYTGPSETVGGLGPGFGFAGGDGAALDFTEGPGGTYLAPRRLEFEAQKYYLCAGVPNGPPQSASALSYRPGSGGGASRPLSDLDPDPDHLTGTTTYTVDDIYGGPVFEMTTYTYTLTYDLTRAPVTTAWDWSVVDRMIDLDRDGVLDTPYVRGVLSHALAPDKQVLGVVLDACPASSVTWTVDGMNAGSGCQVVAYMTGDEPHVVVASGPGGAMAKTIRPLHYLVVGVGDSYGSGEGVPARKAVNNRPDTVAWDDKACHRSRYSSQAQAAQALEKADPKSAVTFLHVACSGATTKKGVFGPQKNPPGAEGTTVTTQITAARAAAVNNPIDAVLVSIGGNDVHFSDIIKTCLLFKKCPTVRDRLGKSSKAALDFGCGAGATGRPGCRLNITQSNEELHKETQGYLKALPGQLDKVASCLGRGSCPVVPLGAVAVPILHTEYPALGQDARSRYCNVDRNTIKQAIPWIGKWFRVYNSTRVGIANEEFEWATKVVQNGKKGTTHRPNYAGAKDPKLKVTSDGLNTVIASGRPGWTPVTGLFSASRTHGYCSSSSWVTDFKTTFANQGDYFGAFHPNYKGQAAFGRIIGAKLIAAVR